MRIAIRVLTGVLLGSTLVLSCGHTALAASSADVPASTIPATAPPHSAPTAPDSTWLWPLEGPRNVVVTFRPPAHDYAAGHRGMDLAAAPGTPVRAPADGVVAFRGTVVDRPLITIEHAGGYVTTFEPLTSTLSPGDVVTAGETIGVVGSGGHTPAGAVHLGVRLDGAYLNPMVLFDGVPRAVLLPCCASS